MAYNYFPAGYMPQQYMYTQNAPASPTINANAQGGIIWVQGEAGAKSYLVAPNTTVQLWDSEAQVIYLKSADASGMPSMKILDYTIRDNMQKQVTAPTQESFNPAYVTKTEFDAFKQEIQKKMIGGIGNESTVSANEQQQ